MTKFDENEEMVAMLKHFKGSLENKIRQAYNSGYGDGFEAGARECLDDVRRTLEKSLRQQIEQTEPQTMYYPQIDGITPSVIFANPETLNIPDACKTCRQHPSNGGSGICHCTLATPKIT